VPRIGVSITKRIAFRDSVQEFSNVYYYEVLSLPSSAQADTFIDNLTTLEKTFHSTDVTFVKGRCWSQIGAAAANNMISQKNLSGTGARSLATAMDGERAYLFRIAAGKDSRGNQVYLRKWFHAMGAFVGTSIPTNAVLQNKTGYTQAERDAQVAAMQSIGDANGSPLTPKLCAKGGRLPDAGAQFSAHKYLEHHQLGDQWRAV
jgi:hypothetical protein